VPSLPGHLDEAAKHEWRRLVPILERIRVLTEADGIALANLCQQYSLLQQAQAKLQRTGLLIKTKSGYIQQLPLIGMISAAVDQVQALPGIRLNPSRPRAADSRERRQPGRRPMGDLEPAAAPGARSPCRS